VFPLRYEHHLHIKSEAILVTGRGGLQGCDVSSFPHCVHNRPTDGGEAVSPRHRPRFTSIKHFIFLSLVLIC
jgi:hypothetical protein